MPGVERSMDDDEVVAFSRACFAPSEAPAKTGAEIEFLTVRNGDPLAIVAASDLESMIADVATRSRLSIEPGGQIELSSTPHEDLDAVIAELRADLDRVRAYLDPRGIGLRGIGLDPVRPAHRVLFAPRYDAMEAYFDADGSAGRIMMTRTASIQVNVDAGPDPRRRWRLAHRIAPAMSAMFANSPFYCGAPIGWRSARLWNWASMDATRTAPVGGDGPGAWERYLRAARVMLIRDADDWFRPLSVPMSFEDWMRDGFAGRRPTGDDLAYHATTLFPPIRPRGHLEIRLTDALPDPWWIVPVVAWTILLCDDQAVAVGESIDDVAAGAWTAAARDAVAVPELAVAAASLMRATIEALPRWSRDEFVADTVAEFADRWTLRGRCPADDAIEAGGSFDVDRNPAMKAAWT